MESQCERINLPSQPSLVVRTRTRVADLPVVIGSSYQAILGRLAELGEAPVGAPYVAYFNMDVNDLDVEIGFPVARSLEGAGDVRPSEIPGGDLVTCTYVGPYDQMGGAYEALTAFAQQQGFVPSGVAYEIYHNSPMDTQPQDLRTQILFPAAVVREP